MNKREIKPWLYVGDYNEVLTEDEKSGGNLRPVWQIMNFQEVVDECRFHDIPVTGPKMTWRKGGGSYDF